MIKNIKAWLEKYDKPLGVLFVISFLGILINAIHNDNKVLIDRGKYTVAIVKGRGGTNTFDYCYWVNGKEYEGRNANLFNGVYKNHCYYLVYLPDNPMEHDILFCKEVNCDANLDTVKVTKDLVNIWNQFGIPKPEFLK